MTTVASAGAYLLSTPVALEPNAGAHLLPEAGARHERTLEAVRCSALFGAGSATAYRPGTPPDKGGPPTTTRASVSTCDQNGKPLLREMMVIRQHLSEAHLPHGVHGDTIHQAVRLIGTAGIDIQSRHK